MLVKPLLYLSLVAGYLLLLAVLVAVAVHYGTEGAFVAFVCAYLGFVLVKRLWVRIKIAEIRRDLSRSQARLGLMRERVRRLRAGEAVIQPGDHRLARRLEDDGETVDPARTRVAPAGFLWPTGARRAQKWFIGILLLSCCAAIATLAAFPTFVPARGAVIIGLTLAPAFALVAVAFIEYRRRRGTWILGIEVSRTRWYLAILPGAALLLFGIFWINLSLSLPLVYTLALGQSETIEDRVEKDREFNRHTCDYRLRPASIDSFGFRYCISESTYDELPETSMPASLRLTRSVAGFLVDEIVIDQSFYPAR